MYQVYKCSHLQTNLIRNTACLFSLNLIHLFEKEENVIK